MPVNLKKTEFAPAGVQVRSSSHTFHPEVTGVGGKVQSKKLFRLKCKLLHLHIRFEDVDNIQKYDSTVSHLLKRGVSELLWLMAILLE